MDTSPVVFNSQTRSALVAVITPYDLVGIAAVGQLRAAGLDAQRVEIIDEVCQSKSTRPVIILLGAHLNPACPIALEIPSQIANQYLILLSDQCHPFSVLRALEQGVKGYLYLGDRLEWRLVQAVQDVLEGGQYLSPSAAAALARAQYFQSEVTDRVNDYHLAVLHQMRQHHAAGQIASQLGRSTQAIYKVQSYLRTLFDVDTNGALLDSATRIGILPASTEPSPSSQHD